MITDAVYTTPLKINPVRREVINPGFTYVALNNNKEIVAMFVSLNDAERFVNAYREAPTIEKIGA